MNIVFDIGHPAQVHLFRHMIEALHRRGDKVCLTSVDKDIALSLLSELNFDVINLGSIGSSLVKKLARIPRLDRDFYRAVKEFQPDLFIGSASFRCAHISKWMKKPCFQMVDTEMGWKEHALYAPFSDKIATPDCFRRDFGKKHVRYPGYQELAYLHPDYFQSDRSILRELDVSPSEVFFLLRFVAWQATHDIGHQGLTLKDKRSLIKKLSQFGRVFITSERALEEEFQEYTLKTPLTRFHNVLHAAALVVTESNTVATEAALLGVPTVRVNSYVGKREMGNFLDLEQNYELLHSFFKYEEAESKITELLGDDTKKEKWQKRKENMLKDKINVTQWALNYIDHHWRG